MVSVSDAAKELFALLNALCGGLFLVALLVYMFLYRERRRAVALILLLVAVLFALNATVVYLVL